MALLATSKDPVFVKKIDLRIWLLRDEVESVLKERLKEKSKDDIDLSTLAEEYRSKPVELKVLEGGKGKEEEEKQKDQENSEDEKVVIRQCRPQLSLEKIYAGSLVISELNMSRIHFFSSGHFLEGQAIVIEFMIPQKFIINANVIYSHQFNPRSKIISTDKFSYRIAADFTFLKEGERTLLRKFVGSITPHIQKSEKMEKEEVEDETDVNISPDESNSDNPLPEQEA